MCPRKWCRHNREFSVVIGYVDTEDYDSCFRDGEHAEYCDSGFRGCCGRVFLVKLLVFCSQDSECFQFLSKPTEEDQFFSREL